MPACVRTNYQCEVRLELIKAIRNGAFDLSKPGLLICIKEINPDEGEGNQ